jgi:hypothetical protein
MMRIDDYRIELRQQFMMANVPHALHEGLVEYFAVRRPTGSFLQAVLENNLVDAALRADPGNRMYLAEIVLGVYHNAPARAWGSPAKVAAWLSDPTRVSEVE